MKKLKKRVRVGTRKAVLNFEFGTCFNVLC